MAATAGGAGTAGPSSGAAKRARDRKHRAEARKIQWLVGMFQATSHHTFVDQRDRRHAGCPGCAQLVARFDDLQCQVTNLALLVADPDVVQADGFPGTKEELAGEGCRPVAQGADSQSEGLNVSRCKEEVPDPQCGQCPDLVEPVADGSGGPLAPGARQHVKLEAPHASPTQAGGHLRGDVQPGGHRPEEVRADSGAALRGAVGAGPAGGPGGLQLPVVAPSAAVIKFRSGVAELRGHTAEAHGQLDDDYTLQHDEVIEADIHSPEHRFRSGHGPAEPGHGSGHLRGDVHNQEGRLTPDEELAEVKSEIASLFELDSLLPAQRLRLSSLMQKEEELENL